MSVLRKTTVYIEDEILRELKHLGNELRRSDAQMIREAIGAYVRSSSRPRPKSIGAWTGGPRDFASRSDQILRAGFGSLGGQSGIVVRHQRNRRRHSR